MAAPFCVEPLYLWPELHRFRVSADFQVGPIGHHRSLGLRLYVPDLESDAQPQLTGGIVLSRAEKLCLFWKPALEENQFHNNKADF